VAIWERAVGLSFAAVLSLIVTPVLSGIFFGVRAPVEKVLEMS
jgi:hypothetical protein